MPPTEMFWPMDERCDRCRCLLRGRPDHAQDSSLDSIDQTDKPINGRRVVEAIRVPHTTHNSTFFFCNDVRPVSPLPGFICFCPNWIRRATNNNNINNNHDDALFKASELASVVVDGLKARPLPANRFPEARVVDLSLRTVAAAGEAGGAHDGNSSVAGREEAEGAPQVGGVDGNGVLGPEYRRSLTCPNPEETNSAVEVTFQVRSARVRVTAAVLLCVGRAPRPLVCFLRVLFSVTHMLVLKVTMEANGVQKLRRVLGDILTLLHLPNKQLPTEDT